VQSAALSFRLAGPGDLKPVLQIYHDVGTWLHDAKGIADQWPREMPEDEALRMIHSNSLYLAVLNGEVAGAVQITRSGGEVWAGPEGDALYLHSLAVCRRFAGKGLGRAMLDWACILARSHGKGLLRLDCMYENPALREYYCQAGFLLLGQHPTYSWYALLEKRLTIEE